MNFYHGSLRRHKVGAILEARKTKTIFQNPRPFKLLGKKPQDIEGFVESYRPRGYPSRTKAIYLVTDPRCIEEAGGKGDYVYEVRPLSTTLKVHFGWFGELLGLAMDGVKLKGSPKAIKAAKAYWRGVKCPNCVGVWEILTEKVQIVHDFGHIDYAVQARQKAKGRRYSCG